MSSDLANLKSLEDLQIPSNTINKLTVDGQ